MLNRLLKHEWKETWLLPALTCIFTILMTLVGIICFMRMEPPVSGDELNVGAFVLFMTYCVLISCVSILICIYFAVRFYRNLYTDEGYLMHTLPVTPRQLILSKMLVGAAWTFLVSIIAVWSVFALLFACLPVMVREADTVLSWMTDHSSELFGMSMPVFVVFMLVLTVVSSFSNVLTIYGAVSLGQLFTRHKVMASILCYLGYTVLIQTVTSFAITPYLAKMIISSDHTALNASGIPSFMGEFMRGCFLISFIGSVITAVISYILTEYIMKRQLNLD